jgi:histidyl-tRNA synthetase
MTSFQAPRGTQDILPEDQPYWRYLSERIAHLCSLYGYEPIDTPTFEDTVLFARSIGDGTDIVEKEMYTFQDKGVNSLTLRPEMTASVVRAYLEHGMHTRLQPVKVYSIGSIFRYDRPQAGRYREFHQFNLEAMGEADPGVDVEIIQVAEHLLSSLGFRGIELQLNSIGCPVCRPSYVEGLVEYYDRHRKDLCQDCQKRLERNPLRLLDCKNRQCQPFIERAPRSSNDLDDACREHFEAVRHGLEVLEVPYALNHRLVRGLDYYTRTVFEMWAEGIGAQSAVCGGGRYDGLAEALGGKHTPGIGFALGMERTILAMRNQGLAVPALPHPPVFLAALGDEARDAGLRLAQALRKEGIGIRSSFGMKGLKAQLRQANKFGASYALIMGDTELEANKVVVRDLGRGDQEEISQSGVASWLHQRLD